MANNILNFASDAKRTRKHNINARRNGGRKENTLFNSRNEKISVSQSDDSHESGDTEASLASDDSAVVIDFAAATADQAKGIKRIRLEFALPLVEAATVLGISASTLEREEAKTDASLNYNDVARKYELHVASADGKQKRRGNLIFGSLPLKVARHILDLSIEQMARRQGYSLGHWKKIETNFRSISDERIRGIEQEVKAEFENLCTR